MIEPDIDDTHLCIKCSVTIVGLDNYIQHRKHRCSNVITTDIATKLAANSEPIVSSHDDTSTIIATSSRNNLEHAYESYTFAEPEPPSAYVNKTEHGKSSKSLSDSYDLPYELGADVFFSSLQLQSVQSSGQSTSGKTGSSQRQKSNSDQHEETWIDVNASSSGQHSTDTLMKAVSDISDVKKPYEVVFKSLNFVHESPDQSDDEEEEEELDVEIDEEDDEFEAMAASHATGGKWKPSIMRHSPPVVPVSHTGGKWKPENRPNLRVTHSQLTRLSPHWEEPHEDTEALESGEHPPSDYTKGKWIPGTKLQHLEYNDKIELKKSASQDFWCNICCRRLRNKHIYENHLKTSYHLKRAEPEQQLEKATLGDMGKNFILEEPKKVPTSSLKKRRRRATFLKCELCKLTMVRQLLGKHLISHYHFRRMQLHPGKSLRMILDNIHSIVLQAPFQCRPCSFYANTEATFLQHWNSPEHLDASEGPGKFWCSFCHFECEDNNQMRRHLLSTEHKEVLRAINRSVPICISKKLSIDCHKCGHSFRYNIELRKHLEQCHPEALDSGTASDAYQSRFICDLCSEVFRSKVSLQRHEKNRHFISKYFCTICNLEFDTPCKARRHRKSVDHRFRAALIEKKAALRNQRAQKRQRSVLTAQDSRECKSCDFVASSEVEAMLHELSHSRISVPKIGENFSETRPRIKSVAKNSKKIILKEMKCKDCEKVFKSRIELKQHRDEAHPFLRHVCMICGQSFALAQVLGRHSRHCQPKTQNIAIDDGASAKLIEVNAEVLEAERDVEVAKSWPCNECNFSAPFESELLFHRLHHTLGTIGKNQQVACPLCSKSFRKHSLRCHLRQHTNEKIFPCTFCELKFSRNHNLKSHIKTVHQKQAINVRRNKVKEKPGQECDASVKTLRKKYVLKMDVRTNNQTEKRFTCSFEGCRYSATSNSALKVHMSSHSQQIFKCEQENCSYVGRSALHLKRHSQCHGEPKKIFNCDKCEFKTKISAHLKRHLHLHTGEKPHKCPHCDFSTALLDNLRKHILKTNIHPGKFIYECNFCKESQVETTTPPAAFFKTNSHAEYQAHLVEMHSQQL